MAKYDVILRLEEKKLSTLLQTVQGYTTLQNINVVEEADDKIIKRASPQYVNGKRKGISADDLSLQILSYAKRAFSLTEIENEFVKNGFSGHSCSPALSRLKKAGKVKEPSFSMYELVREE